MNASPWIKRLVPGKKLVATLNSPAQLAPQESRQESIPVICSPASQRNLKARAWRMAVTCAPRVMAAVLMCLVAGTMGYYWRALHENSISKLSRRGVASLDYLVVAESFSEVENSKAVLQAAAEQIIMDIRTRPGVGTVPGDSPSRYKPEVLAESFAQARTDLENAIAEFRGSEQEMDLVQEMLWLVQRQGDYAHWTDVYLSALYAHPTHPMIGVFAERARRYSQLCGREKSMADAFQYLRNIPMDYDGKQKILATLDGLKMVACRPPKSGEHL